MHNAQRYSCHAWEKSDVVEIVSAPLSGSSRPLPVGKRIPGQNIYWVGPTVDDIIEARDLAGVPQNTVSIFNNGPRTYAFAKDFSKRVEGQGFRKIEPPSTSVSRLAMIKKKNEISFPAVAYRMAPRLVPNEDIYLFSKFMTFFQDTIIDTYRGFIEFEFIQLRSINKKGRQVIIRSPLMQADLDVIKNFILNDDELMTMLSRYTDSEDLKLVLSVKVNADRVVVPEASTLGFRPKGIDDLESVSQ
jgi:hypothetical protein